MLTKTAGPCATFPAASCADSSQTACQCAGRVATGSPRRALGGLRGTARVTVGASASHSSRMDGACCSCAPAISSSACRSHAANSRSKVALAKLDKYHLLILDDIVYVSKDQAETSVLFELTGTRYERRSMLITANPAVWRLGQGVSRPSHDARRHRPPRPSLDHLRDERRKLSSARRPRSQARTRTTADARDNQGKS